MTECFEDTLQALLKTGDLTLAGARALRHAGLGGGWRSKEGLTFVDLVRRMRSLQQDRDRWHSGLCARQAATYEKKVDGAVAEIRSQTADQYELLAVGGEV